MTIALRRQIACYTDLAAILALVDPCPSIDEGYVDDAGLAAYAAAIERRFGLVCDLAGKPGHLFPEGYDRPRGRDAEDGK